MPYAEDSLFTLTPAGIAATVALAVALWAAVLLGYWRLRPRAGGPMLAARAALALLAFWGFVWISPQAFYWLYRTLIPGLPAQWVVGWPPPDAETLLALATFTGPQTLSAHGQGVLGWSLMALALARKGPRPPRA